MLKYKPGFLYWLWSTESLIAIGFYGNGIEYRYAAINKSYVSLIDTQDITMDNLNIVPDVCIKIVADSILNYTKNLYVCVCDDIITMHLNLIDDYKIKVCNYDKHIASNSNAKYIKLVELEMFNNLTPDEQTNLITMLEIGDQVTRQTALTILNII